MHNILIIEDNLEILKENIALFSEGNYNVFSAETGIKALSLLNETPFHCIILDILLPDLDGFTICKAVRTITDAPIIFLTCMDEVDDKLKGFMLGGDDYMTKPYSLKELQIRVKNLIRRTEPPPYYEAFGVTIKNLSRVVATKERQVLLSPKEYALFMLLFQNKGKIFTKTDLLQKIWYGGNSDINTVSVHISRLRKKLAFIKPYVGEIETAYGIGYYFPKTEDNSNG